MRQWKGRSVRLAHRIVVRDLDYLHSIDDAAADANANAKDGRRSDRPTDRNTKPSSGPKMANRKKTLRMRAPCSISQHLRP